MEAHGDQLSGTVDARFKKGPDLAKWIMVNLGGRGGGRRKRDNSHEFIRHLGVFLALALVGFW
jgi:hypothetical protein